MWDLVLLRRKSPTYKERWLIAYCIKKYRYNPMIITALNCAYSRHLTLRNMRSYCLLYVTAVVHLLKLLAKIEKRIQSAKRRV